METPPNKRKWGKNLVTDSVNVCWTLKLKDKVNSKTTLNYLNVDDVMIGNDGLQVHFYIVGKLD
jgi:hypothetical protein